MLDRLKTTTCRASRLASRSCSTRTRSARVANFQSQLERERETIRERIESINRSLRDIDYNPGRYIVLEAEPNADPEIRDFQQDLRACTEGALTGSMTRPIRRASSCRSSASSSAFAGAKARRSWTAAGRARSPTCATGSSFPPPSAGARTTANTSTIPIRAASRAGRRRSSPTRCWPPASPTSSGSRWGAPRSRSFRFVVIDEAFGRGSDESARYGLELFARAQSATADRDAAAEDPCHRALRRQRRLRAQRGRPAARCCAT